MNNIRWDWVLWVAIIIFIWSMGRVTPEFQMEYVTSQPKDREPPQIIDRTANFDHGESPNWDNPPNGPVPYDQIPEITQRQFDWKWRLPSHGDE